MGLEKDGYIVAQRGTTRQKVGTNSNGDLIADENSEVVAGAKYISINMVNADNSFNDNAELFNKFLGFIGVTATDPYSNQMTVKWEVA